MQDAEIRARLAKYTEVVTVSLGVVNKIVDVETDGVVVRSERTGNNRRIKFNDIRNWNGRGPNGRIRLALAKKLGLT